jgi:putative oxidoreductase
MIVAGNFEFAQDPIGIGSTGTLFLLTLGEFVAPIFLILGFQTRIAAIVAGLVMFVKAVFMYGATQLPMGPEAENALLFLVGFASIYLLRPGKYSLDKK